VIQEGLVRVVEQLGVVGVADAAGELVVVVCRQADQGEDLAGLRVHHDDDATLDPDRLHRPDHRRLCVALLLGVDRECQRVTWLWLRDRLQDLGLATGGVLLDALTPVDASQLRLVLGLDPDLAEKIIGEIPVGLELGELITGDGTGVAEDLRHQGAVGVLAPRLDGHLDTGQVSTGFGDQASGALVDVGGDPDEVECRTRIAVDRRVDISWGHPEKCRKPLDDDRTLVERQIRGAKLDHEGGHVRDECSAVPIIDQPPWRHDRLEHRLVVCCERGQTSAIDDLKVEEAGGQAADGDDDDEDEGDEAGQTPNRLRAVVEEGAHQSNRSDSARRSWMEIASGPISAARTVSKTTPGSRTATGSATGIGVRRALKVTSRIIE
jgi:hypothetical protein